MFMIYGLHEHILRRLACSSRRFSLKRSSCQALTLYLAPFLEKADAQSYTQHAVSCH